MKQHIAWFENTLELLDQRYLPQEMRYLKLTSAREVALSIKNMVVRGGPAIGITAAYGVVLTAISNYSKSSNNWRSIVHSDIKLLLSSRPTAINLKWALDRMGNLVNNVDNNPIDTLLEEALRIHREDIIYNKHMASLGATLLSQGCSVLTHCNTGTLATGGYGTALGVIRTGYRLGLIKHVYVCETRPLLQGARLTVWELIKDNIPVTLIIDSAASALMQTKKIDWIIVGADRIAANGDVINKIGTYNLALSASLHQTNFMVVAPTSTIDLKSIDGLSVPIEFRDVKEVLSGTMHLNNIWNPSFDCTPAHLVNVLITERGIIKAPNTAKIADLQA